jgi:hypothetical protein
MLALTAINAFFLLLLWGKRQTDEGKEYKQHTGRLECQTDISSFKSLLYDTSYIVGLNRNYKTVI